MANRLDKRMFKCFLSLGSNQGNRMYYLNSAVNLLHKDYGTVNKISSVYLTEGWGSNVLNDFYNIVIEFQTNLSPFELLTACKSIEKKLGRKENVSAEYENRVIDIDILLFDDLTVNKKDLVIPHKEFHNRRFVLEPLSEITSELILSGLTCSVTELLQSCQDRTKVLKSRDLIVSHKL
jgi:2-amino-4-hydroxy-6-hydroxymethyldihydropteridine diphosphokinase